MSARAKLTAAAVVATVDERWGEPCARCASDLVGHDVVLSLMLGFRDAPLCAACLAAAHQTPLAELFARAARNIRRLACYRAGWEHSDRRLGTLERWPEERVPSELRMDGSGIASEPREEPEPGPPVLSAIACVAELDAGDKGCGELVLDLRVRLKGLAPGDVLRLVARDAGAPEDIPAWCRLTGHRLRGAEHPVYLIERKPT